jgi:hypothetical protein
MKTSAMSHNPGESEPLSTPSSVSFDVRLASDFAPQFYPQADGAPVPPGGSGDRDDTIKIEFCAVYYQLNRLHACLSELRQKEEGSSPDRLQERELLEEVENHLRLRDALEDKYAPYGVIAEPILEEGFTTDIRFTFGDRNILRQQRTHLVSSSALILFPPEGGTIATFLETTP